MIRSSCGFSKNGFHTTKNCPLLPSIGLIILHVNRYVARVSKHVLFFLRTGRFSFPLTHTSSPLSAATGQHAPDRGEHQGPAVPLLRARGERRRHAAGGRPARPARGDADLSRREEALQLSPRAHQSADEGSVSSPSSIPGLVSLSVRVLTVFPPVGIIFSLLSVRVLTVFLPLDIISTLLSVRVLTVFPPLDIIFSPLSLDVLTVFPPIGIISCLLSVRVLTRHHPQSSLSLYISSLGLPPSRHHLQSPLYVSSPFSPL